MYLTYIVSCGRTYYTSQTLTRPVVIVMYCLASIWLLANLGPLLRMLPERGAGLGLGSNYGLRCPLAKVLRSLIAKGVQVPVQLRQWSTMEPIATARVWHL